MKRLAILFLCISTPLNAWKDSKPTSMKDVRHVGQQSITLVKSLASKLRVYLRSGNGSKTLPERYDGNDESLTQVFIPGPAFHCNANHVLELYATAKKGNNKELAKDIERFYYLELHKHISEHPTVPDYAKECIITTIHQLYASQILVEQLTYFIIRFFILHSAHSKVTRQQTELFNLLEQFQEVVNGQSSSTEPRASAPELPTSADMSKFNSNMYLFSLKPSTINWAKIATITGGVVAGAGLAVLGYQAVRLILEARTTTAHANTVLDKFKEITPTQALETLTAELRNPETIANIERMVANSIKSTLENPQTKIIIGDAIERWILALPKSELLKIKTYIAEREALGDPLTPIDKALLFKDMVYPKEAALEQLIKPIAKELFKYPDQIGIIVGIAADKTLEAGFRNARQIPHVYMEAIDKFLKEDGEAPLTPQQKIAILKEEYEESVANKLVKTAMRMLKENIDTSPNFRKFIESLINDLILKVPAIKKAIELTELKQQLTEETSYLEQIAFIHNLLGTQTTLGLAYKGIKEALKPEAQPTLMELRKATDTIKQVKELVAKYQRELEENTKKEAEMRLNLANKDRIIGYWQENEQAFISNKHHIDPPQTPSVTRRVVSAVSPIRMGKIPMFEQITTALAKLKDTRTPSVADITTAHTLLKEAEIILTAQRVAIKNPLELLKFLPANTPLPPKK